MTPLDRLIAYFEKFPGVGARQAKRFAFHILTLKRDQIEDISELINTLPKSVTECFECRRFFSPNQKVATNICSICSSESRDKSKLIVVSRDSDIQAIERSDVYNGLYFVLGGVVSLLNAAENNTRIRTGSFKALVEKRLSDGLSEVILAFAINPDGENTGRYVEGLINDIPGTKKLTISHLGRGLSTGSELEYADPETIKSSLKNRN